MQVILLERVPKLGQMGEIVAVKDGFARNFLIPKGKALRATERAKQDFDKRRQQLETQNLERREEAEKIRQEIAGRSVVILRQASESRHLYGSVSSRDIAAAFTDEGVSIERAQVVLDQPLKMLGVHEVTVALHPEVEVTLVVNIARTVEEAEVQAGRAQPVSHDDEAEESVAAEEGAETAPALEG
ncbi:50S ribosomal protein L9 [Marinimicrococcus flavescens]|uniref:Large ribosomal subunit protein bL9 n=1 Tax=Marinimicrococcus flavescens TaxID=3031815 RepID=A0AAP3XPS4_9PROT|nr:50S ribosomal protein L9 [Marinimicrococcus flavescens]